MNLNFRKLLLFEYVTGGGLCGQALPASLAAEGGAMLQSLISDCRQALPDVEITVLRDARFSDAMHEGLRTITVTDNFTNDWRAALEHAEAVWIIAPETEGVLLRLVQEALAAGKRVLNASADAIALCSSKLKTAQHLQAQGIDTVPTLKFPHEHLSIEWMNSPVIVKPDDGAGCIDTFYFPNAAAVKGKHDLIQPYIAGKAMSMSVWCEGGGATLLSINEQQIGKIGEQLNFEGCTVNSMNASNTATKLLAKFQTLGSAIARAVPGLWGPVGVDLMLHEESEKLTVIEINPRMTTSFTKLRETCDINIASLIKIQASAL